LQQGMQYRLVKNLDREDRFKYVLEAEKYEYGEKGFFIQND